MYIIAVYIIIYTHTAEPRAVHSALLTAPRAHCARRSAGPSAQPAPAFGRQHGTPTCPKCRPVPAFGRHSRAPVRAVPAFGQTLRGPVPAFGRRMGSSAQCTVALSASWIFCGSSTSYMTFPTSLMKKNWLNLCFSITN